MNKFTENLYLKIKTKIWWLLLGLVVFCVLWHKKMAGIFKSNVIEGARSKSSFIHIIPNSALSKTTTASDSGPGNTTTAPSSDSGNTTTAPSSGSGNATTAPSSGSGNATTTPSSGSGNATTAPVSDSGSSGTTTAPTPSSTQSTCDPDFAVGDEVQVNTSDGKLEDGTVSKIISKSDGTSGCEYHIKFCSDGKIHIFDESVIYPPVEGGSCPTTSKSSGSSKKSTSKRGSVSKTLHSKTPVSKDKSASSKTSASTTSNLPHSSYGCSEFTIMVTNREDGSDGKTSIFTTTGDRGSMPCPFNGIVKSFGSTAQSLYGWVLIQKTVVDGSNAIVYDEEHCNVGPEDEKWSYISATDSSYEKASVEIKSNSKAALAAKDTSYKIFFTYSESQNAHAPTKKTSSSRSKTSTNPSTHKKNTHKKPTTPKRTKK